MFAREFRQVNESFLTMAFYQTSTIIVVVNHLATCFVEPYANNIRQPGEHVKPGFSIISTFIWLLKKIDVAIIAVVWKALFHDLSDCICQGKRCPISVIVMLMIIVFTEFKVYLLMLRSPKTFFSNCCSLSYCSDYLETRLKKFNAVIILVVRSKKPFQTSQHIETINANCLWYQFVWTILIMLTQVCFKFWTFSISD